MSVKSKSKVRALLVRFHVLDNIAEFRSADWAQPAPEKLVGPPSPLVHHEMLCEAHGLRVASVSVPHALLLDCFAQRLVAIGGAVLSVASLLGFRVVIRAF